MPTTSELRVLLKTCFVAFAKFFLIGVVFSIILLVMSSFQSGMRSEYFRYLAAGVSVAAAAVGLIRAAWVFVSYCVTRPG